MSMRQHRFRKLAVLLALGLLAGGLAGCYESEEVVVHEPGEYKGPEDPLLAKLEEGGLRGRLDDRFNAVQTDR